MSYIIEDKTELNKKFKQELNNARQEPRLPRASIRDIELVMRKGLRVMIYSDDGLRCVDVDGARLRVAVQAATDVMQECDLSAIQMGDLIEKASLGLYENLAYENGSRRYRARVSHRTYINAYIDNHLHKSPAATRTLMELLQNAPEGSGERMVLMYILATR